MNSLNDVWNSVMDILGKDLTPVAITTWFDPCRVVELFDNKLVISVPTEFKKNIIEQRFSDSIRAALRDIFSCDFELVVLTDDQANNYSRPAPADELMESGEYTFERFVVGNSNKFAHAAALAVANGQINNYNPLFIYGASGLGKTHLLYAIRHVIRDNNPDAQIVYVKGDDFTNELIAAIQTGKNVEFREKYRNADLFLMDDVQFIAGKQQTQEEFFHTFNTLYEANRQIVLTSDRPPNEIMRLTDRLQSRFESGMLADIQPPDYETRMAIIINKASQLGLVLSEDVMVYIAENITSNVRQIEGAVKKVMAYRDIMDDNITVASATKAIKDMFKEKAAQIPTPDAIIDEAAKYYSLTSEDIKGESRTRNTALARQISIYLIRKITNLSLTDIGKIYSRDHTTILSSIRRIERLLKDSTEFSQTLKDIHANINARSG